MTLKYERDGQITSLPITTVKIQRLKYNGEIQGSFNCLKNPTINMGLNQKTHWNNWSEFVNDKQELDFIYESRELEIHGVNVLLCERDSFQFLVKEMLMNDEETDVIKYEYREALQKKIADVWIENEDEQLKNRLVDECTESWFLIYLNVSEDVGYGEHIELEDGRGLDVSFVDNSIEVVGFDTTKVEESYENKLDIYDAENLAEQLVEEIHGGKE